MFYFALGLQLNLRRSCSCKTEWYWPRFASNTCLSVTTKH